MQMEIYDKKVSDDLPIPQLEINDHSESSVEVLTAQTQEASANVNVFTHTQVDLPEPQETKRNQAHVRTEDYVIHEELERDSPQNTLDV
jgi:hypothetical protein